MRLSFEADTITNACMETFEQEGVQLHRWRSGPSTFVARPELGARLMSWDLQQAAGKTRSVIYWPENDGFANFPKTRGGNPILFPFAARTYDKGTLGQWRDQHGAVRPMPQHGFTRDGEFRIQSGDESGFTAELISNEDSRVAYPFDYTFSVRYEFSAVAFRVYFTLKNHGEQPILWSAGHHFYFALPWHPDLSRDNYQFSIPAKKCYRHAADGSLQAEKKGWEQETSFGNPANSDRIYTKLTGRQATFGPAGGEESIGIRILDDETCAATSSAWNAFVVWTESDNSPFYCVEPWMGPPNSPEHGKGLHAVAAGDAATFGVEVALLWAFNQPRPSSQ